MLDVQKIILRTICYFDIFDYPLTLFEIYIFQYHLELDENQKNEFNQNEQYILQINEILICLENLIQQNSIIQKDSGFYFLKGREAIIKTRKERYELSIQKYRSFFGKIKILSIFPFIDLIGVCNSTPLHNAKNNSDIDIFIVSRINRLWTCRFFVVLFLKLFKMRPTELQKKDKLCPSFFMSFNNLNLEPFEIGHDSYLRFWVATMLPMYTDKITQKKWYSDNLWLKKYIPNFEMQILNSTFKVQHNKFEKIIKSGLELFSKILTERIYKKIQLKALPQNLSTRANKDSCVVITDSVLKFHNHDKRKEYQELFKKNCIKLGI